MADIGEKLRSAREAKGLSIQDIEKTTKIQSRYLTAIEQNDFDKLPGDFYVRAFIRQYASVVGLDGKELLEQDKTNVPAASPEKYVENSIDNKSEEVHATTNSKKGLMATYLPKLVVGLIVVLVIVLVYLVSSRLLARPNSSTANKTSDQVTVSSQKISSKKRVKSNKSTTASKSQKPKPKAVKIVSEGNSTYRVTNLANDRKLVLSAGATAVWSQVTVDGQSAFSGTLNAAQKQEVNLSQSVKQVSVTLGNATSIQIEIAGHKVPLTKSNSPETLTILFGSDNTQTNTSQSSSSQSNGGQNGQ